MLTGTIDEFRKTKEYIAKMSNKKLKGTISTLAVLDSAALPSKRLQLALGIAKQERKKRIFRNLILYRNAKINELPDVDGS